MLARHAAVRRGGDPRLSIIVGEPDATRAAIEALLGVTPVDPPGDARAIAALALDRAREQGCLDHVLTLAASALEEGNAAAFRARWRRLGPAEKRATVEALRDRAAIELADVLQQDDDIVGDVATRSALERLTRLAALEGVVLPPVALHLHAANTTSLVAALDVAQLAPRLPLVLASTRAQLDAAIRDHRGTRVEALLRQGIVVLRPPSPCEPKTSDSVMTTDEGRRGAAIERTRVGLAVNPESPELRERARSLAERRLYDALQARETTRGRFELNTETAFRFGSRHCEIDLCDPVARIAVEVDGYHHFTSHDAYRRDRRKDVLLQREGFVVLRFLDCDVFDRLEFVLQAIEDVQYHRATSGR